MAFTRTSINTTGNTTSGSASITNVASTTGMFIGMMIYGPNIRPDTVITNIVGTTVTMDKTALATGTATAITGQYIIQTGTDSDPSALSTMTGVTTITGNTTQRRQVFDLGFNQLRIQGSLGIDPDVFEIIGNVRNGLSFETGSIVNFGVERVVNGRKTYSKGTGLVSTYVGDFFTLFGVTFSGGTFNWYGGVIQTFGPISHGGASTFTTYSFDAVWRLSAISCQFRSTGTPTFNALTVQGINVDAVFFLAGGWNAFTVNYERTYYQTPAGGGSNRTILNPQFANNQADADLRANQASGTQQVTTIKNPDVFPRLLKLSSNAFADFPVVQALSLSVTDSTNTAVGASEVVAYIKDSNNGARLNSQVTNYVNDRVYLGSSTSAGAIVMGDILTLAGVNVDLVTATINLDYRSNFGNGSADFNIYLGGYKYNGAVTRETLIGNNGTSVKWTMFNDPNITLSRTNALAKLASSFTVNAATKTITVTANSTYDDVYDIAKAWKYNGVQANIETPTISDLVISADGSNLMAYTGWKLIVNNGVTLSEGTKFTKIKFDTVTINGAITGIYETNAGTSTIWEFGSVAEPIIAGTSLAIYDGAGTTKYYNAVTTDGVYRYYIAPQAVGETFTYAIEKYGTKRESGTFPSNAGGILFYVPSYGEDVGITETNLATVQAYTTLADTAQIYDATANFRLSETGIKLGQLVARDGMFLDFNTYNVKLKDDASAIVGVASGTITYKSIVINETTKYNAMKATPPATITVTDNELINVVIEDANGDSQLTILGGDNLGYELWKVTTATATDDYATGTLLITLATNTNPYRFIGISGYDIVGRDVSSGVRRRSSMSKGVYEQAFYVGNQIQLASDAPQLVENNEKLSEVITKLDAKLDVAISTRLADADYVDPATPQQVWEYTTRTLTSAGSGGATLAEIEASTVLAMKADVQAVETKVDTKPTLAEMEANTSNIAKQDAVQSVSSALSSLENTIDLIAGTDFDGMTDSLDAISTKVDTIQTTVNALENYDDTILEGKVDDIKTKVLTLENYNDATAQAKLDAIKAKTDTLVNTDLTGVATTTDVTNAKDEVLTAISEIPATDLTEVQADLNVINEGVQKASLFIPHTTDL